MSIIDPFSAGLVSKRPVSGSTSKASWPGIDEEEHVVASAINSTLTTTTAAVGPGTTPGGEATVVEIFMPCKLLMFGFLGEGRVEDTTAE